MAIVKATAGTAGNCARCNAPHEIGDPVTINTGTSKRSPPVIFCCFACARPQGELYAEEYRPLFANSPQKVKDPGIFKPRVIVKPPALFAEAAARPTWEEMQAAEKRRKG